MRNLAVLLLALAPALVPAAARADAFFFPGYDAESVALGGARTADAAGVASVAYNPAGLHTGLQQTSASFLWAKPVLYIAPERNAALEAYLGKGGAADADRRLAAFGRDLAARQERTAERPALLRGLQAGVLAPLAPRAATATTSVGFAAFIPQGNLATLELGGESAPLFVEFQDRNRAAMLAAAVAHDFGAGLRLGAGAVLDLVQADVVANVFVPLRMSPADVLVSREPLVPAVEARPFVRAQVAPRARLVGGALYERGAVSFGASFRDESNGRIHGEGSLTLASGDAAPTALPFQVDLNTQFQPRRAAAGVQWRATGRLALMADVNWVQWSHYRPPLGAYRVGNLRNFVREALAATGLAEAGVLGACLGGGDKGLCLPDEQALLARVPTAVAVRYELAGARDIWVPRLGAAWRAAERVTLMAGAYYRPSIEASGGFRLTRVTTYEGLAEGGGTRREAVDVNLLDNAQAGASAGATVRFGNAAVSLTALAVHLIEKRVDKTASDVVFADRAGAQGLQITDFGYPGYRYGGYAAGGMGRVSLAF